MNSNSVHELMARLLAPNSTTEDYFEFVRRIVQPIVIKRNWPQWYFEEPWTDTDSQNVHHPNYVSLTTAFLAYLLENGRERILNQLQSCETDSAATAYLQNALSHFASRNARSEVCPEQGPKHAWRKKVYSTLEAMTQEQTLKSRVLKGETWYMLPEHSDQPCRILGLDELEVLSQIVLAEVPPLALPRISDPYRDINVPYLPRKNDICDRVKQLLARHKGPLQAEEIILLLDQLCPGLLVSVQPLTEEVEAAIASEEPEGLEKTEVLEEAEHLFQTILEHREGLYILWTLMYELERPIPAQLSPPGSGSKYYVEKSFEQLKRRLTAYERKKGEISEKLLGAVADLITEFFAKSVK